MKESLSALSGTTKTALLAAGEIIRRGFARRRRVEYKELTSPVTDTDRAAEKKIMSVIRRAFPGHTFLAEESAFLGKADTAPAGDRYRWVIDPLDGTVNFVHGVPMSVVSIAVERNGVPLVGGVYDPFRNELFFAVRGRGARLNGSRIRVSGEKRMIRSLFITGFPYDSHKNGGAYLKLVQPFLTSSMGLRRFGAAALDLAWVACGRAEGFWECKLSPWDIAAGMLLVEEAGGRVTDFSGRPMSIDRPAQTLASNGHVHPAMLRIIRNTLGRS